MAQELPRIDHVVVNVADQLDQALAQYRRLGFLLTPRGHHSLGSSNHLAIFGTDYLELIGYEPHNAGRAAASWGSLPGLSGLVFKTADADALYADLAQRGVRLDGEAPQAFFRPVELPDGSVRDARFRIVRLDPAALPNGRIFFCQHLDPDLVWRSAWQRHPNGVSGIVQTVIEARDPAASIRLLERTFGAAATSEIDGGWRLSAGGASIDYLRPEAVRARFGEAAETSPNGADRKVALTLRTDSLARARAALQDGGIAFGDEAGRLIVPASQACGVALAFSQ
jgi:catechol 2,3-dioxygenase-like lactoylglutathione lyase family enzyme